MESKTFKYEKVLMMTVLIAAFVIRILNIRFGYPLQTHADEPVLVEAALDIVNTGDLNPHIFLYPSLTIYLQALIFFLIQLPDRLFGLQLLPGQVVDYYVYARALTVLFSTATIYIVYEIGRRLFGTWTGLGAMVFLSVSSAHVMNGYFATVDTPTAFWASLACLMAVMIYTGSERKLWQYLAGGICVGLATGSKYTACLSVLPILVAHAYHARLGEKWLDKNVIVALLAIPVVFLITTPYALLDFNTFFNEGLLFQSKAYTSHTGYESETTTSFRLYLSHLYSEGYGEVATLLALTGLMALLFRKRLEALLLMSFPLALFLLLGSYKVYFSRNILPVIPVMALLSGYGFTSILDLSAKLRSSFSLNSSGYRYAASGLAVLLVFFCVKNQIAEDMRAIRANTLPDTRWVSLQWIERNIPAGTRIGRERYAPPIEFYSQSYWVDFLGIGGVANVQRAVESMQYVVVSSYDYDRFLENPEQYPAQAETYRNFFACNQLIKEFADDGETMSGPTIRIYRITYGLDTQACKAQNKQGVQ